MWFLAFDSEIIHISTRHDLTIGFAIYSFFRMINYINTTHVSNIIYGGIGPIHLSIHESLINIKNV